ncbi:MAG: hypothetical protein J6Q03_00205 [Paludibacteraceae bacterium]|nr:hypothetical protein [Paludibacteraceae bacterium]MBO6102680.1 hypothetical protein [Opitutales bacterium]MBO7144272.1 hypothetical protein [Salinivirgaceae bacterium]
MAKELIQKYWFTVPATTGTQAYQYVFKSDELYKFLTGIACPLVTALPSADEIKIELRDDFKSILSFSPVQNWCKNTSSADFDLTAVFRPVLSQSAGKNYYLNVRVTNSAAAFTFVALFRQSNEQPAVSIFGEEVTGYDMQSFTIKQPALGSNYNINLPSDYDRVAGVNFVGGDTANIMRLALDINDSVRELLDPVPVSILAVTENQGYDKTFFPVAFESKNKQVNLRLTQLDSAPMSYTATDFTVTFLLTR